MIFPKSMNLRTPLEFRYFSKNATCGSVLSSTWTLISVSAPVSPIDENEPTQAHLSIGDATVDGLSMVLSFVTNAAVNATVRYGVQPDQLTTTSVGTYNTYAANMMCASPANLTYAPYFCNPGYLHTASLAGLQPQQTYYYQYAAGGGWSDVASFQAPPPAGHPDTVRMAAFGDMGAFQTGTQGTLDRLYEHAPEFDMVLHIGDISYAEGNALEWDHFGNEIFPLASRMPYQVSIGNHEYDYLVSGTNDPSLNGTTNGFHPVWGNYGSDSQGECGVPTFYRFTAPHTANSNAVFWYAFGYGSVYIVQMSSEHDYTPGSAQYNWLEATLQTVDRKTYPWVVLTTHRPLYTSENYAGDYVVSEHMQDCLEDLFLSTQVNLVLAGHYHSYERTCAVNKGVCVTGADFGTVHVIVGMAGMSLDTATYMKKDWSLFHDQVFGYSVLEANATTLALYYHHDANDEIADFVVLSK